MFQMSLIENNALTDMDAKYKHFMCRLCLCISGTLGDIHGCKVGSGLVAAAVVTDLLQLEVSATDCYPQLVCLECLKKLYDFRRFKDSCWKAKDNFESLYLNATPHDAFSPGEKYDEGVKKVVNYGESMESSVDYPNPRSGELVQESKFIPEIQIKEELIEESDAKDPLSLESPYGDAEETLEEDITIRDEETQINKRQSTTDSPVTFVENIGNMSVTQIKSEEESDRSQEALCMEQPESPSKEEDICREKNFTESSFCTESSSATGTAYASNHVTFNSEIIKEPEKNQSVKNTVTPPAPNNPSSGRILLLPVNLLVKLNVPGQTQSNGTAGKFSLILGNGGNGMEKSKECKNSTVGEMEAIKEGKNSKLHGLLKGNVKGKNIIGDEGQSRKNPTKIHAAQFFCNMCSTIFPSMNNLVDHNCEGRVTKNFECKECGKKYETEKTLKNHARKHKINKNFICQICGKGFRTEPYLTMHFASHKFKDSASIPSGEIVSDSGPPQNISDKVEVLPNSDGATSSQTVQLEQKVWKSNTGDVLPVCPVCCRIYSTLYTLKRHIMQQHSEKNFKCVLCPKKFRSQKGLDSHARKHRENRPFRCDVCGKGFFRKDFFEQHVSYHARENPFQCDRCKKKFNHKKPLWTHILRCYKMKTVHCSVCDKEFNSQSYLAVHMTIHTGEKNLTCEVCGKSFRGKNTLLTHRRQHTGEKPYSCDICNKSFIQRTSYVIHNRRYHS